MRLGSSRAELDLHRRCLADASHSPMTQGTGTAASALPGFTAETLQDVQRKSSRACLLSNEEPRLILEVMGRGQIV
ncbi:hypothetical protein P8C59_004317 [Phyllachora maydis]|uniref:Uncharacterized protein n=1 Tax=Phyllachora maydis TaxID=1825666 RepID=A0AAD9I2I4_9PEZI|nr:hypothetical protein P8C59_004317 [Phyllachora maydis]